MITHCVLAGPIRNKTLLVRTCCLALPRFFALSLLLLLLLLLLLHSGKAIDSMVQDLVFGRKGRKKSAAAVVAGGGSDCLLYTSPSPRD